MKLGLREATRQFSKAMRAVRAGEEVVLTERGVPVAVIEPLVTESDEETALQAMASEGLITPAARKGPMPAPRWRPAPVKGKSISRTVIDDRAPCS